jgi:site-specific DNA-methyltransferase (adenine-specific)
MAWQKPVPVPKVLHTAFAHVHETLLWASKSRNARYTFNYDLINSPNPSCQVFSIWRIPTVPRYEKPTQKPLRLVRRALLASTHKGNLIFDPFTGSEITAVATRELNRPFVGAEPEEEFGKLAIRCVLVTKRGSLLHEISEQFCSNT